MDAWLQNSSFYSYPSAFFSFESPRRPFVAIFNVPQQPDRWAQPESWMP